MNKPLAIIIEDDPALGEIFSLSLQKEFDTEIYADGGAALRRLAEIVPALIVLDLHLPTVSGMFIFTQIRADKRFVKTRIILSTADAVQADFLSNEADLVLLKPISPIQLRQLASRLQKTGPLQRPPGFKI